MFQIKLLPQFTPHQMDWLCTTVHTMSRVKSLKLILTFDHKIISPNEWNIALVFMLTKAYCLGKSWTNDVKNTINHRSDNLTFLHLSGNRPQFHHFLLLLKESVIENKCYALSMYMTVISKNEKQKIYIFRPQLEVLHWVQYLSLWYSIDALWLINYQLLDWFHENALSFRHQHFGYPGVISSLNGTCVSVNIAVVALFS